MNINENAFHLPSRLVVGFFAVGALFLASSLFAHSIAARPQQTIPLHTAVALTPRLASDSPLVADSNTLFALAEDRKTILARPLIGKGVWETIHINAHIEHVGGLALAGSDLYISDASMAVLLRVRLFTGASEILHQGPPFESPEDLAVVRGKIYVADHMAKSVFCLSTTGGHPEPLDLASEVPTGGRIFLASAENDLILARPDEGKILEVRYASAQFRQAPQLQNMADSTGKKPNDSISQPFIDTLQSKTNDQLHRPAALSFFHGIIYVVDEETKQIFAFSRHARRPIRVVGKRDVASNPTRILVTGKQIFILNGTLGTVESWPMLIPAEIHFESETSEAMSSFYEYLYDRGILPTRAVPLRENLEKTLREQRVLLAPYVQKLDRLLCELNPQLCPRKQLKSILQDGTPIIVPDLYWESYIDTRRVTLDGSHTLGDEVDRHIQSPELGTWKEEQKLIGMNPEAHYKLLGESGRKGAVDLSIRGLRQGTFTIPVELIRYAAAVPAEDLTSEMHSQLATLLMRFKGFSVFSMEENRAKAYVHVQDPPVAAAQWEELRKAYEEMLRTINYFHPPAANMPVTPYIGIAEAEIDCEAPDFAGGACQKLADDSPIPASITAPLNPTAFKVRNFEQTDHGTAVASLVAARQTQFKAKGLAAPEAVFVQLHDDDQSLGEDIRKSHLNFGTRIFNFSFTFPPDRPPVKLMTYVDANSRDAYTDSLFVVAAGNGGSEVTCVPQVYPVCWSNQSNVLAVAATVVNGTAFLPESNWGKKFVHLAAPGEGFSASGRNQSYVPLKGTSFAVPLVTATAALLYAQGVFEPALIKQRIIATSDFKEYGRDRMQGGLLNVRRAVSFPARSVLIKDGGEEKVVQLLPGARIKVVSPGGEAVIPLANVRRLTRNREGDYRIIYVGSANSKDLLVVERASFDPRLPWTFKFNELDPNNTVVRLNIQDDLTNFKDFVGAILH